MNQPSNHWPQLAIAIIPFQEYGETFPIAEALKKGTLFPALYQPYEPGKGGTIYDKQIQ
ncbi:MAG TPA: spore coat associated protein CotJA [Ruminococcaceae bacterium]|nr:spore coat associated protein CotJA [Oscillospiraceae bacterium]